MYFPSASELRARMLESAQSKLREKMDSLAISKDGDYYSSSAEEEAEEEETVDLEKIAQAWAKELEIYKEGEELDLLQGSQSQYYSGGDEEQGVGPVTKFMASFGDSDYYYFSSSEEEDNVVLGPVSKFRVLNYGKGNQKMMKKEKVPSSGEAAELAEHQRLLLLYDRYFGEKESSSEKVNKKNVHYSGALRVGPPPNEEELQAKAGGESLKQREDTEKNSTKGKNATSKKAAKKKKASKRRK